MLIILVLASLGLIVAELRSPNRSTTAGRWTFAVFSPLFQGGRWTSDRLRDGALALIQTQAIRKENDYLRAENGRLALEVSDQRERIAKLERERTSELPKLPDTIINPLYANVIGISLQRWDHSLMIDRGELDGVRKAMPVVDYSGAIVGIVAESSRSEAMVRLLTDPGFAMGAMVEDNASRDQGLLTGLGEPGFVQFRPNEPQKLLGAEMEIISTGFKDSLYPKGLRIGRIARYSSDKFGTALYYVKPHANFDALEEVIVVDSQTVSRPAADSVSARPPAAAATDEAQETPAPAPAVLADDGRGTRTLEGEWPEALPLIVPQEFGAEAPAP